MTTFIYVGLFFIGLMVFMSIFIKPSKESNKVETHKPTTEEFDRVMQMLLIHGIISNNEYTNMYGRGRAFTKKK